FPLWLLLSLPHISALCLPTGCSWARAEKLRWSCCSFFTCAFFQDGPGDAQLHPCCTCTVVVWLCQELDLDSLELPTYSQARPAASSPWLNMHPKENTCCTVLTFLPSESPQPALPHGSGIRHCKGRS
ncbi:unnamed protein product, partial [Bubo scandiacus]